MKKYAEFTNEELVAALELMVSKDDLKIRDTAETLLDLFCYTAADIRAQLSSQQYLSDEQPLGLIA